MITPAPGDLLTPNAGALASATTALHNVNQVDPGVAELVAQWRVRLDHAFKHDEGARENYEADRKVAAGVSPWLVDTNLVGAILEILAAHVYAKDPDFQVAVAESVNNTRLKTLKEVTESVRIVTSRLLKNAGLKLQMCRVVRSAQTCGPGWVKASLTTHSVKDPIVQNEINTLKENLARVGVLQANLDDGEVQDEDAARQEIQANILALEAKLEKTEANGVALDYFCADDVQVSPECGELVNYLNAPWIRYRTYKSKTEAQQITGWPADIIGKANLYTQKVRHGKEGSAGTAGFSTQQNWIKVSDGESQTADGFVCFEEIWSKRDGVVYTMVDGINDRWAREPYAPVTGSRFYDGFMLAFHYVADERHPQSDVTKLRSLQDEYGRTRSNFAEHRKRAIPITIWDAAQVPQTELNKVNSAEALENVAINFTSGGETSISQRLYQKPATQLDPSLYTTQPITVDMEKVSGAQDAMQGSISTQKTATEANIEQSGFGARIGVRRDSVEELCSEIGLFVAQLALLKLPARVAVQLAGPDTVWPKLTVDEVLNSFEFTVKAGSTGRPDKRSKSAAWSQMLPLIEKMITVVGNFRSQGPQMEWAAKPYIAMLEMTFDLLDMGEDVERFMPHPPPPPPPDPLAALLGAAGGAPGAAGPAGPMVPAMDAVGSPPKPDAMTAALPQ